MGADTKAAPEFRRALARQFSTERNFNLPTTNLEDRKISPLHFSSYLQISINKGRKKQEQARALNLSVCLPACLLCSALNPGAPSADISSRMGFLHQRLGGTSRDLPFVRRFKPREIEAATSGPRGTAYRARFADGLVATVRRAAGGDHEEQEDAFYRELQLLGRLNHRHVVRLRGFSEGHNRFLVFDQMENRSLKECLHDPLRTPLNWRTRLQVAIDVAAALEYLYYFCDPPVFHVTVNSSNVMMDADFVAKLSDVTVVAHDSSQVSEEQIHERRSDLAFQYGVLLLVLVTGQSPGGGDGELVRWVQEPGFAGSMQRMVDADLGGTYDAGELRDLVIVARLCTRLGNGAAVVSIPQVLRYMHAKVDEKNR